MGSVSFAHKERSENFRDNVQVIKDCEERDAEEEAQRPPEVCNL